MSSTVRQSLATSALVVLVLGGPVSSQSVSVPVVQPLPAATRDSASTSTRGAGSEWDQARAQLRMSGATAMAQAVERWQGLTRYDSFAFNDYAGFLLAYRGFPEEDRLRRNAERALERGGAEPGQVVAYFDRIAPLTNAARAQYALALARQGRPEAHSQALAAWRGGAMSEAAETALAPLLAGRVTADDQDARMDALLWAGSLAPAQRQLALVSPTRRDLFQVRLAALQGNDPVALGLAIPASAAADPGFLYNRARQLIGAGRGAEAAALLAARPRLDSLPTDPEKWVALTLSAARNSDPATAVRLATLIDDSFAQGADLSRMSFRLRDDYTSLMWLGGTKALWTLAAPRSAAPLFWRYGMAARTPQTRAKGLYWAGRALASGGDTAGAAPYFTRAAIYADQFYGQLALERLGRTIPAFATSPSVVPSPSERQAFLARPIVAAVREVARESDWPTAVRFFKEIAAQAETPAEHQIVADLARELGRRDLGVILGQAAGADGIADFQHVAFPLIPIPEGADWTMVHAISRQESQFAQNAVSHAGARGLMQLMPGTAREQAGKVGLAFDASALMNDPGYNLRLGDGYFGRMMDYFGGSYPLAVAAYNAGPGNVNKWLRANGDPRTGTVDWIDWIERIPVSETRNYVQRVLENAVVYEAMNPDKARVRGPAPLSHFLGRSGVTG
ncbi:lytic transglycosylase domain-containing protein [Novosphingobium piscinae]|uniref:Lytic transglycosylase domain-containing protein n=1 Tax=Novosphingobium piscinae TaxID=1507448 RepID=A0A7X1KP24_9SPHN|nr:lytic transglycosylase domain-containing protein [Novosphingobium piscinae]MBC2667950.1 lytic transglycosylase domain-containing protein [Novosphingobium piscinae]